MRTLVTTLVTPCRAFLLLLTPLAITVIVKIIFNIVIIAITVIVKIIFNIVIIAINVIVKIVFITVTVTVTVIVKIIFNIVIISGAETELPCKESKRVNLCNDCDSVVIL